VKSVFLEILDPMQAVLVICCCFVLSSAVQPMLATCKPRRGPLPLPLTFNQDLADQLPSIANLLNGIKLPTIPLVRSAQWWRRGLHGLQGCMHGGQQGSCIEAPAPAPAGFDKLQSV